MVEYCSMWVDVADVAPWRGALQLLDTATATAAASRTAATDGAVAVTRCAAGRRL